MKILAYIMRNNGGVGRVLNTLAPEMKKLGHQLEVVSREDDLGCFSMVKSVFKMNKDIKTRDYDILLTNDWSIALPFILKPNHFSIFHGIQLSKISRIFQQTIGKFIGRKLMVVGPGLLSMFPASNYTPNGIDTKKFFDMNVERKCLGWVKREHDEIGLEDVQALADEMGLELSVAEGIHPDKMNEWYNSLQVFISKPTGVAGFNLCWVEAYRAGVPIILGNDNGIGINNIRNEDLTAENQARKIHEVITR